MTPSSTKGRAGSPGPDHGSLPPLRLLFLAWGYSLHAERRIRVFSEDPGFEVVVASPYDYRIPGVRLVRLADESARRKAADRIRERQAGEAAASRPARTLRRLLLYFRLASLLGRIGARDPALLRHAANSFEALLEIEVGREDFRAVADATREFRPDAIFLQTLLYPCYIAFFLPRRIPRVVTFWNGDVTWWAEWTGLERLLKRHIVAHGARTAAAVTVNSRAARDACRGYGVPEERIHLIRYPGVDLSRFSPGDRDAARRSLGVSERKVVLCPRGIGGYLNSDVIVEAAAAVARRVPEVLFLFVSGVGGEEIWAEHLRRARELGIEWNVRRDGQVPWEAMPDYYRAADVMVSVSSRDSLPNCLLEAMACGVPVVAGDIPALREWVEDGVNGFLASCRDPAALAERISMLVRASPDEIEGWTGRAAALVRERCDREAAVREVKTLVARVARGRRKEDADGR